MAGVTAGFTGGRALLIGDDKEALADFGEMLSRPSVGGYRCRLEPQSLDGAAEFFDDSGRDAHVLVYVADQLSTPATFVSMLSELVRECDAQTVLVVFEFAQVGVWSARWERAAGATTVITIREQATSGGQPVAASFPTLLRGALSRGAADLDRDEVVTDEELFTFIAAWHANAGAGERGMPRRRLWGQGFIPVALVTVADPLGDGDQRAEPPDPAGDRQPPPAPRGRPAGQSDDARILFGLTCLLDRADEDLTVETAGVLLGRGDAAQRARLLGELVDNRDIAPAETDGHRFATEAKRKQAWEIFDRQLPYGVKEAAQLRLDNWRFTRRPPKPPPRMANDSPTTRDDLGYGPYADAIAAFIRHQDTSPPLTIGVAGTWGAGKSSLMGMVRERLDPSAPDVGTDVGLNEPDIFFTPAARRALRDRVVGPLLRVLPWRRGGVHQPRNDEVLSATSHAATSGPLKLELDLSSQPEGWRPTVWFNPWVYQNGEQVWAGLVHEIIEQTTGRLAPADRELFWLALNMARVDRGAVRRRLNRLVVERLAPQALGAVVAGMLCGLAFLLDHLFFHRMLSWVGAVLAGVGGALMPLWALLRWLGFRNEPAARALGDLVRAPTIAARTRDAARGVSDGLFDLAVPDPGYTGKVGFLHLVHADVRRVLSLVATPERPLVVFVDDLDRCSPGAVTQVIEAINLFLAGAFKNCVFVLAIEPHMVAAHVQVAYQQLVTALAEGDAEAGRSPLGWRFLEKIVQLSVSVPPMDPRFDPFLRTLFGLQPEDETATDGAADTTTLAPAPTGDADLDSQPSAAGDGADGPSAAPPPASFVPFDSTLAARIRRRLRDSGAVGEQRLREEALKAQAEFGRTARQLCAEAWAALTDVQSSAFSGRAAYERLRVSRPAFVASNPRAAKRYVNLFSFYTHVAFAVSGRTGQHVSDEHVARLAELNVRWPHLFGTLTARAADGERVIATLERAAAADANSWDQTVAAAVPSLARDPRATAELRGFLARRPPVSEVVAALL